MDPLNFSSSIAVDEWRHVISKYRNKENGFPCFLMFTKSDAATSERLLKKEQLTKFCRHSGIKTHVNVSAKNKQETIDELEKMLNECSLYSQKPAESRLHRTKSLLSPRQIPVFDLDVHEFEQIKIQNRAPPILDKDTHETYDIKLKRLRVKIDKRSDMMYGKLKEFHKEYSEIEKEINKWKENFIANKIKCESIIASLELMLRLRRETESKLDSGCLEFWKLWHKVTTQVEFLGREILTEMKATKLVLKIEKNTETSFGHCRLNV
eukprot:UN32323